MRVGVGVLLGVRVRVAVFVRVGVAEGLGEGVLLGGSVLVGVGCAANRRQLSMTSNHRLIPKATSTRVSGRSPSFIGFQQ